MKQINLALKFVLELAAPRARRRLGTPVRAPFELSVFALAVVNAVLMTIFRQWES